MFEAFPFLASGFLVTWGNLNMFFTVVSIFGWDFFLNGFPYLFIVHSRPSFMFEAISFSR